MNTVEHRQHARILGPFDGSRGNVIEMPVQIYDLSLGGCFVNSMYDSPPVGRAFKMTIDLPGAEGLVLRAETVYSRPGFGYAVRFLEMSDETTASLRRAMEKSLTDREE